MFFLEHRALISDTLPHLLSQENSLPPFLLYVCFLLEDLH